MATIQKQSVQALATCLSFPAVALPSHPSVALSDSGEVAPSVTPAASFESLSSQKSQIQAPQVQKVAALHHKVCARLVFTTCFVALPVHVDYLLYLIMFCCLCFSVLIKTDCCFTFLYNCCFCHHNILYKVVILYRQFFIGVANKL